MFVNLLTGGLVCYLVGSFLLFGAVAHLKTHFDERMVKAANTADNTHTMQWESMQATASKVANLKIELAGTTKWATALDNKVNEVIERTNSTDSRLDQHLTQIAQKYARDKARVARTKRNR